MLFHSRYRPPDCSPSPWRRRPRARGSTLLHTVIVMVALAGFCSLGVDWGRVRLVKAELAAAADAAARAGAAELLSGGSSSEARDAAVAVAARNVADGRSVALQSADVRVGRWDGTTFVNNGTPVNAIEVTAEFTAARGTAVPLSFAQLVGRSSMDVRATATAMMTPASEGYAAFGKSEVKLQNNAQTDSYNSAIAPYASSYSPDRGSIASNVAIDLRGNSIVRGDAREANGGTPEFHNSASVTGSTIPLAAAINYPDATSEGYGAGSNDNANIPGAYRPGSDFQADHDESVSIPSGHYYFTDFTVKGNAAINVTGPVVVYVTGNLSFKNNGRTGANLPADLVFKVIGGGTVDLAGNNAVYADIYAPQSNVDIKNSRHLYGRVVGDYVNLHGNSFVHYDEALGWNGRVGEGVTR